MKTTKLQERGFEAAKKFLQRKGYIILDDDTNQDAFDLVAEKDDIICFIPVAIRESTEKGFPEETFNRSKAETASAMWLKEHESTLADSSPVRFDAISILVLSSDRAFLRHHINVGSMESDLAS